MRIEYHRTLLADHVRNRAFLAALRAHIIPGRTVVADIGTGTGLLGLMAARLGARRVYMYEAAGVGAVAERVLAANRSDARVCELIAGHSTEMMDPPRVDLVVSETLGNYALEENIVATLTDAVARHLAPGGAIIPTTITQHVAPVVSDRIHRELTAWDDVGPHLGLDGLDFGPARSMSFDNVYVRLLAPADLLDGGASAVTWDRLDLAGKPPSRRKGEVLWTLAQAATIHGFAVWWTATLAPDITLSTGPDAPRTHWEQLYFPLASPIVAGAGDRVSVTLMSRSSEAAGTHLAWTAVHSGADGRRLARHAHDLDRGFLP